MVEREELRDRCRRSVRELSRLSSWNLSDQQIDSYVAQLVDRVPAHILATKMQDVVGYFHADHGRVAALKDKNHALHPEEWAAVEREIAKAAQRNGLGWSRDPVVEPADLVQIVVAEVVRSLDSYGYASSLHTWVHGVSIRRLRRFHRDNGAAKRAGQVVSLDAATEQAQEWDASEPEILASALADEIARLLDGSGDKRYWQIFRMREVDGLSNQEIALRLKLHPSRIRALLQIARTLLRQEPSLRHWLAEELDRSDEEGRDEPDE